MILVMRHIPRAQKNHVMTIERERWIYPPCLPGGVSFEAARAALELYPRYAAALEELGKLQLDQGLYARLGSELKIL